jgi:hypothetical protein
MNRQNIVFALFLGSASIGCATSTRTAVVEPETVGQLAPSYASIAVAPVHHDAPPELGQVVDTDEDAPVAVAAPAEKVEAPEIAPKTDGVTVGSVR